MTMEHLHRYGCDENMHAMRWQSREAAAVVIICYRKRLVCVDIWIFQRINKKGKLHIACTFVHWPCKMSVQLGDGLHNKNNADNDQVYIATSPFHRRGRQWKLNSSPIY